jgi:hypothetical protein
VLLVYKRKPERIDKSLYGLSKAEAVFSEVLLLLVCVPLKFDE